MTLPVRFILDHIFSLGWSDLLYGYERDEVGWTAAVEYARGALAGFARGDTVVAELAAVVKDTDWRVRELLTTLAARECVPAETSKKRWLFLLLLEAWENRADQADPLARVEELYADFNYPDEIAGFVRFMPATDGWDPTRHTREENEQQLFDNWRRYLDCARLEMG